MGTKEVSPFHNLNRPVSTRDPIETYLLVANQRQHGLTFAIFSFPSSALVHPQCDSSLHLYERDYLRTMLTVKAYKLWQTRQCFPGLGLPIRQEAALDDLYFPRDLPGHERRCLSALLPVCEVAMMDIMDKLTDREEWHKKVFDKEVVSRWKQEALEVPDQTWWLMAAGGKWSNTGLASDKQYENVMWRNSPPSELDGIVTEEAFDYVGLPPIAHLPIYRVLGDADKGTGWSFQSVCRSCERKLAILRKLESYQRWMLVPVLQSPILSLARNFTGRFSKLSSNSEWIRQTPLVGILERMKW